ncbi:MAG: hypothetical protein ACRDPA_34670 [Solirubrobacteraceae bacterium]
MYSLLHAQMIRTQQEEIARAVRHPSIKDVRVATSRSGWVRRRAGKTVAAFGVCLAAIAGVAVSDASARSSGQSAPQVRIHVSAMQLQREMNALEAVDFVATSCEIGGTRMTNYRTGQSLLLPW